MTDYQKKNPTESLGLVMKLLKNVEKQYPVDKKRIYLIGLSAGAFATWDLLMREPNLFAAAIPISGDDQNSKMLKQIAHIPIWAFHGSKDDVVPPSMSIKMIKGIQEQGGSPNYTEYKDLKHICWNKALSDPIVLHWLFGQKKK